MRITGGRFRGRVVEPPKNGELRPTQDMVREALFNILAPEIPGADFLDLFAGSGAVGIEAASRGAGSVTFVESNRRHAEATRRNAAAIVGAPPGCGVRWDVAVADVGRWVAGYSGAGFSVVFADPPYALWDGTGCAPFLRSLADCGVVRPGGLFVAETGVCAKAEEVPGWDLLRDRVYGKTRIAIWRRDAATPQSAACGSC